MSHVYGEVIIEVADNNETASDDVKHRGKLKIPFKNENIAAYNIEANGRDSQ